MKLPTCVLGIFRGQLRWEKFGGGDVYQDFEAFKVLRNVPPKKLLMYQEPFAPLSTVAITHLQKRCRFAILLMSHEKWWQLCFHFLVNLRYQQEKLSDGNVWVHIPGSEISPYFRVGYSRAQITEGNYVKGWTLKIWKWTLNIPFGTWYGPGLHMD